MPKKFKTILGSTLSVVISLGLMTIFMDDERIPFWLLVAGAFTIGYSLRVLVDKLIPDKE